MKTHQIVTLLFAVFLSQFNLFGSDVVLLGNAKDRVTVGDVLYESDFSDQKNWTLQFEKRDHDLEKRVKFGDGMLDLYLPERGCTAWLNQKFSGPIAITYQVRSPLETLKDEGIQARDINNFWHASDPREFDGIFDSDETHYNGNFVSYHEMHGYYASSGGGGKIGNQTTRFRRYPRHVNGEDIAHLSLNSQDGNPDHLITPGKWHTVQLVACDGIAQYILDGELVYEINYGDTIMSESRVDGTPVQEEALYSRVDYPAYTEGYFGLRLVGTHHQYKNLKIHQLDRTGPEPLSDDDRMAWWRDAGFGMFIHWGLYAIPAGEYNGKKVKGIGEWIMDKADIPVAEYEKFAPQFDPVKFDADEWVSIVKDAGMKYIVITTKHHDGFCLWDSDITNYDIMEASPFKRDIIGELAAACKKHGIKFCTYYSIVDWHHPNAQAPLYPNYNAGQRDKSVFNPEFPKYYENYFKPQVQELLTNYGDIGVVWFDGDWIPDYTTEMGKELYELIRNTQPNTIVNNRVDKGRAGMKGMNKEGVYAGDFGTPEKEVPDEGIDGLDWESCITMNDTWGFKHFDHNWKSEKVLIQMLVEIVSKGGNLLLNVGPTAEGLIPAPSIERLAAIGDWMNLNSESVHGAKASPFEKPEWGRYTAKGNVVYAHIFDWPEDGLLKLHEDLKVKKVTLLANPKVKIKYKRSSALVKLPSDATHNAVTVLKIELK